MKYYGFSYKAKTGARCARFGSCSMTSEHPYFAKSTSTCKHETELDLYKMSQDLFLPEFFGSC